METQKTLNSQIILIKNNKAGGITLPYFKLCNKVTVINIMVLAHTKRHIVQCKRIEPRNECSLMSIMLIMLMTLMLSYDLCLYEQLVYNKGSKSIQWRKDNLVSKRCWENWTTTCKRIKLDYCLTPCIETSLK